MTDYTVIDDDEIIPDAPIPSMLGFRWRDNPIAMFEGAADAPRLQLAALDAGFITAGGVGSYVFATRGTGTADVAFGDTIAGSILRPTSAVTATQMQAPNESAFTSLNIGAALSGTWQAMGTYDHVVSSVSLQTNLRGATLWLRIA